MNKKREFKPVIGLEVHIELATASKMFCGCPADHFGKLPNTQICPVCLGLPGALPVPNKQAVEWTVLLGMALGCRVNRKSKFDRKHYFYPDLPKGYQISQYDQPLCYEGEHRVRVRRVHLEEDTGKLQHTRLDGESVSLVDFNRSGVPLVELVTEPDFDNVEKVIAFLQEIQRLVRYLKISDADMEKGSMRLEANISLARAQKLPGYKVELKNINSFRFLAKALEFEIKRQREELSKGLGVTQETRGWDEAKGETRAQRSKEEAHDYRYFPEPDIPPLDLSEEEVRQIKKQIPKLPEWYGERLGKMGLPDNYIGFLVENRERAEYFIAAVELGENLGAKMIADALVNRKLEKKFPEPASLVRHLRELGQREYAGTDEMAKAVEAVLNENAKAKGDYQKGKEAVIGFLMGQVQKLLAGKGEAKAVREAIMERLGGKKKLNG